MSRATVLARGRAAAERGMRDSCVITRPVSASVDKVTGAVTPTSTTTVYAGVCRLQQAADQAAMGTDQGEAYRLMTKRELQLPVATSADVRANDIVTITACVNDAALVGMVFTVRDEAGKSEATARRLGIQAATS